MLTVVGIAIMLALAVLASADARRFLGEHARVDDVIQRFRNRKKSS